MDGTKIAAGVLLTIAGLVLTVYYTATMGTVQIFGPTYIALGLGVYFLGLDLAVNGILDNRQDANSTIQSNQINSIVPSADQRLDNIEESMKRIEAMVKKWDFI